MSKCSCGQADIPLGVTSMTAGGLTHGVTACVSCWGERTEVVALSEEVALLRAQVQRVREYATSTRKDVDGDAATVCDAVLELLDGAPDD